MEDCRVDNCTIAGGQLMAWLAMLVPERDLKGATPETLAKALLRNRNLRPGTGGKPVVRNEAPVEKPASDQPGDSIPHLRERP